MKTLRATLLGVLFCAGMALVAMPATAQGGAETMECKELNSDAVTCNGSLVVVESLEDEYRDWLDAQLGEAFRPDEQLDRNGNGGGGSGGGGSGGGGSEGNTKLFDVPKIFCKIAMYSPTGLPTLGGAACYKWNSLSDDKQCYLLAASVVAGSFVVAGLAAQKATGGATTAAAAAWIARYGKAVSSYMRALSVAIAAGCYVAVRE